MEPCCRTARSVFTIIASSTDIDGDTITYFAWTGPNGQMSNHANQPVQYILYRLIHLQQRVFGYAPQNPSDGVGVSSSTTGTIYVENGCPPEGTIADSTCPSTDCLSILDDGHANVGDDGVYWINPDGNGAYQAYCDMTPDGEGGPCATPNADMVHIQTETSYTGGYGQTGYRTDCHPYRCSLHQS